MTWDGRLTDTGWVVVGSGAPAPAFVNGWTDYTGAGGGGGYIRTRFRRKDGIVHLQVMALPGTLNSVLFTLPPKFRPAGALPPLLAVNGTTFCQLIVNSVGGVQTYQHTSSSFVSAMTSFPAEA